MNFRNVFLIGVVLTSVLPVHAHNELNADRVGSIDLARACSRLLEGHIVQLQNSIIQHMISVQQMPDTPEVRMLIEQEVVIRFYKAAYNKIWEDKQSSSILPPKVLWLLPIPRDFKMHVENESAAHNNAIQNGLIQPITSWFPAVAKKETELIVNNLTEQEMLLLLYGLYAKYFSMFHPWTGRAEITFDYSSAYETERKNLTSSSSPESRALFRRLYTPEEYEAHAAKIMQQYH